MTVGFSFVTMSLAAAGKCKLVGLTIRLWNAKRLCTAPPPNCQITFKPFWPE